MNILLRFLIAVCLFASAQTIGAQQNPGDPLYHLQWHLTGMTTTTDIYGVSTRIATAHINVAPVWEKYRGEGMYVAILDTKTELTHPDLIENISTQHNIDFHPNIPILLTHGTSIAGIAAARGYNNIGVRGVAPSAKIIAVDLLGFGANTFTIEKEVIAITKHSKITAASNHSYVNLKNFAELDTMWYEAIRYGITEGFYGKGTVYVWGAGNFHCEGGGHCNNSNSNYEERRNHHAIVTVCAVDYRERHNIISEFGANLWVCTPSDNLTAANDAEEEYAIVTTITTKDHFPPHLSIFKRDFEKKYDGYTDYSSGTSSAAPMVTGTVALIRQANQSLSWRDVKLILAASAKKNDPNDDGWQEGGVQYGSFLNQYHFNHKYGFGLVDAHAAVELAENWINVPERANDTIAEDLYTTTTASITRSITIQSDIDFIEHVDVHIDFRIERDSDFSINLVSPSATISKLAVPADVSIDQEMATDVDYRFGSSVHLGEDPSGDWKLQVSHTRGGVVTLRSWKLRIRGFQVEMKAVADDDLSDLNIAETPLTLSLSGGRWKEEVDVHDFRLKHAPVGLSIASVRRTTTTQVQLMLNYDSNRILDNVYDFQVEATTETISNLGKALSSNNIEIAPIALKADTIPPSAIDSDYDFTVADLFASSMTLDYTIAIVDEEDNVLPDAKIAGLTINGPIIDGTSELKAIGTYRLKVTAHRSDGASRTEYFTFNVELLTKMLLKVYLEGLLKPAIP